MNMDKEKTRKQKPKYNLWQNSVWMIQVAWQEKEKKVLLIAVLSALLAVAVNLIELFVVPVILNAVETHVSLNRLITTIIGFVAALAMCRALAAYLKENEPAGKGAVRRALYGRMIDKLSTTSYPNVSSDKMLGLSAKVDNTVGTDEGATYGIWAELSKLLKNTIGFVIYMLLISSIQPWILATVAITGVVSYAVAKRCNDYRYQHQEEERYYGKRLWYIRKVSRDTVIAKDIHIFGLRNWLQELYTKAMHGFEAFHEKVNKRVLFINITDLILTFLRNGIAYAYLIQQVLSGKLSASEFLLYFTAVTGFASWVTGILDSLNVLQRYSNELAPLRELLEYPEVFAMEEGEPLKVDSEKAYELCLEHVSFRYPEQERDILKDINLTLRPGEKLAIVGLNGAGKTTLIKLMCGFLDPTEGRVLLDRKDIRLYNRQDYYQLFSAVFQEFLILPTTVAANVAQSETDIDMERVKECLDKAGLREKVESVPNQYETLMNREVYDDAIMFSGGESQRLMLARALYKDAPFIILDEPTAALDPIAEADMYAKYHAMTKGKSSVYISHRLASTRFCDRILLLDQAKIIEEGTHDELLALGGRYAELFAVQSKYYQEGGDNHDKTEE